MPEAFTDENGYASFQFCDAEFGTQGFSDAFDRYCLESDYILVAFGDDDLNLLAAPHGEKPEEGVRQDFKRYDIEIIKNLYLDERKRLIVQALERGNVPLALHYAERYLDTELKQKNADLFCVGASERGDFVILLSEEELPPCKVLGAQAEGELPFRIVFFPISKKGKSSRNGTLWDFTSHTLLRAGRKTPDVPVSGIGRVVLVDVACGGAARCLAPRGWRVRLKGLEPPRLASPDPKSGAATNYATAASSSEVAQR